MTRQHGDSRRMLGPGAAGRASLAPHDPPSQHVAPARQHAGRVGARVGSAGTAVNSATTRAIRRRTIGYDSSLPRSCPQSWVQAWPPRNIRGLRTPLFVSTTHRFVSVFVTMLMRDRHRLDGFQFRL